MIAYTCPAFATVSRTGSNSRGCGNCRSVNCDNYLQVIRTLFLAMLLAAASLSAAESAADLGRAVRAAGLDAGECYRIHDIEFRQEDMQFYLTSGYLIFGKPVNGNPVSAVFSADNEGGDAEVLMLPPDRAERHSLAAHTGAPNLDEHFKTAIFLFTDAGVRKLLQRGREMLTDLLVAEVAASVPTRDRERLAQELIDLGFYAYCRKAMERWMP